MDQPGMGEGDLAAGQALELGRQRVVEGKAKAERAQDLRRDIIHRDRHRHHLQQAAPVDSESRRLGPGEGGRDRRPSDRARRRTQGDQDATGPVGHHEDVGLHPAAVVAGEGLHRRRVAGGDRGLQLRQVGHEPRHLREGLAPGRVVLVHQRRGFDEAPPEPLLHLRGHPRAHEVEGHPDGDDREEGSGHEHAVLQGREQPHQFTTKSSSTAPPPSGMRTVRVSRAAPSFQATAA